MKSKLISIPDFLFPACKVKIPFSARVSYEVYDGKLGIMEIAMSPAALKNLSSGSILADHIEKELQKEIVQKPVMLKAV